MAMSQNQKGFSIVEVAAAFVVVLLVGFVGYLFYTNVQKNEDEANKTSSSESNTANQSDAVTATSSKPETKTFNGGFGVDWVAFDYPSDWRVERGDDGSSNLGPGIILKSPEYKIVDLGQAEGPSGNYIEISSTKNWNASITYWESQQQASDPLSTFGHFTFAGKPAVIWRGTTAQDTKKPPVATLSDMYKGEDTKIQGDSIIYTFHGSRGSGGSYNGNEQELYDAINTVLSTWKWL